MSQKLFNINIRLFGDSHTPVEDVAILELVEEAGAVNKDAPVDEGGPKESDIRPAADILEFTYPPESPFYKK